MNENEQLHWVHYREAEYYAINIYFYDTFENVLIKNYKFAVIWGKKTTYSLYYGALLEYLKELGKNRLYSW